jgi:hypothetical protein
MAATFLPGASAEYLASLTALLARVAAEEREWAATQADFRCLSYSLRELDPEKPSQVHRCRYCDLADAIRARSA